MRKVTVPELGQRIKEARMALRYQQKEFASLMEIAPSYLSEVEGGKIKPGFEFFQKITGQFNVNPMFLLHGEEPVILEEKRYLKNWPGPEKFGNQYPDIHKLLWYMSHSSMVSFGLLEYFQRYLAEHHEVIHKDLKSKGKSYPGIENETD